MITFKLDKVAFERAARQLAVLTQKDLKTVLDDQARLLVRDLAKMTPPFQPGNTNAQSWASQRRIGIAATTRDLERIFPPPAKWKTGSAKNAAFETALTAALKRGDIPAANAILSRGRWKERAALVPDERMHAAQRTRYGRVRRRPAVWLIARESARLAFIRERVKRVGIAKSGWSEAAVALGLRLPNWITNQRGRGSFRRLGDPAKPAVEVGNLVPFIQETGADQRIVQRALRLREINLERQLKILVDKLARKQRSG